MALHAQDPTPCPMPRPGLLPRTSRLSMLPDTDPSVTLPHVGLRDAKPRRPTKKPSVGWDPTVDICEDTFRFRAPTAADARHAAQDTDATTSLGAAKASRRSTIFSQPPQKISAPVATSDASQASERQAHKRRLSSVTGAKVQQRARESLFTLDEDVQASRPVKDARRRTIYVPSDDTTIATIHPGRSLHQDQPRHVKPRRSDIFLDIVSEQDEAPDHEPTATISAPNMIRRPPRQSILAAPRRAPLQPSSRPSLANVSAEDVPGKGDGKENLPPGLAEVKRLGKRASFLAPGKPDVMGKDTFAPILEEQVAVSRPVLDNIMPLNGTLHKAPRARPSLGGNMRRASLATKPRESIIPRDVLVPQNDLFQHSTARPTVAPHKPPPSTHTRQSALQAFPVLSEDIAEPSLYEENWLSHQEQALTQVINALFEKAGHPSKDAPRHHHAEVLRQDLLNLYQTPENMYMHKRLEASLQFGALAIPAETLAQVARFKDDCGQRQRFLDLWLKTYTLDSLEAAATTVVGRQCMPVAHRTSDPSSADRTRTLARFLTAFLVHNEDREPSSSSAHRSGNSSSGCDSAQASTWRRTVLRSLMLVHLLDRAQTRGLFDNGVLLFQSTSPYKSSLAVLQGLCRLLVPCMGDVGRTLAHLGFGVAHAQGPIDEFQFVVGNVAVDLRDGVRLVRLVEILVGGGGGASSAASASGSGAQSPPTTTTLRLHTDDDTANASLSAHLKYPCPSRTQKIHNAHVALAALSRAPHTAAVVRDIRPEDIVDGHREKTVRLLWELVSRWGLERLVDFALVRREIDRLRRCCRRNVDDDDGEDAALDALMREADSASTPAQQQRKTLLHAWAAAAARIQGVRVRNLSTSFADGRAYAALVGVYAVHIPSSTPPATSATTTASASSASASGRETRSATARTLAQIGCSAAFVGLIPSVHASSSAASSSTAPRHRTSLAPTASMLPSSKTTVPVLAYLAARLLPAAQPSIAASRIQRAWRAWSARRRRVCRRLAQEAAMVVCTRERIEWAAVVLQRRWRGLHWLGDRRFG